jgi:hypothetical protein
MAMPITVQAAPAAAAERDNALVGADAAFRSTTAETAKKGMHPEFGLIHVCEADYARQIAEIDSEHYHHLQLKIIGKKLAIKKRDADIDIALLKSLGRRLATIRDSVRDVPGNSLPECEAALQLMHRMVDDHEDRRFALSAPSCSVAPPQSFLVSRADRLNAPAIGDDDLSWLAEFETQDADACDRDAVPIREAAQVSDCLAPRLRTSAADALSRGGVYPPRYYASTNSIRPEYMSWASRAIQELRAMGAISTWSDHVRAGYAVGDRPWMVMPLIVQPKPGPPGRFRLIHDCWASDKRPVKLRFKMEALHHFVKQLSYLDKLFSADIESAYHHIEIVPRHRTLRCFSFDGVMYVYNVLPFGLTTSASVFCAFTAVTARALRNSGLVSALIVYVDDFCGSIGHLRDPARMDAVLRIIRSFGWVISPSKSTSPWSAASSSSVLCSTPSP